MDKTQPQDAPTSQKAQGASATNNQLPGVRAVRIRSIALRGVFILLISYTLYFAREFLLPVVMAFLLSFVLQPIVRMCKRIGVPNPLSAALLLLAVVILLFTGALLLSEPASKAMAAAPETMQKTEEKLRQLLKPAEKLKEASAQVEKIAVGAAEPAAQKVELKRSSVSGTVLGWTRSFLFAAGEVFILLYFLLAAGDAFIGRLIKAFPRASQRRNAIELAAEIEQSVSKYLFTITLINFSEGALLALGLWLVHLPNPLLWGVMAALLNYIPYLGFLLGVTIMTLVSFVHYDSLIYALIPPAIYLAINILDQFISPIIQGRRLELNPVMVFLSLAFWGWLWGLPGVFLAVPLLMTFKLFCDQIAGLNSVGKFLGG